MAQAESHLDKALAILDAQSTGDIEQTALATFRVVHILPPDSSPVADELAGDSAFIVLREPSSTESARVRKPDVPSRPTKARPERKSGGKVSLVQKFAGSTVVAAPRVARPPPPVDAPRLSALAAPRRRVEKFREEKIPSVFLTEEPASRNFLRPGAEQVAEVQRHRAERIQRLRVARGDRSAGISVASEEISSELRREAAVRTQRWREEAKRREERRREAIRLAEQETEQKRKELIELRRKKIEAGQRNLREAELRRLEERKNKVTGEQTRSTKLKQELEKRSFRSSNHTAPKVAIQTRPPAATATAAGPGLAAVPQQRRPGNAPGKTRPRLYQLMLQGEDKRKRVEEEQRRQALETRRQRFAGARVPPRVNIVM